MKKFLFSLTIFLSLQAQAESPRPLLHGLAPVPVQDVSAAELTHIGFQPLFDEETLNDWVIRGGKADFVVNDGMITGTGKDLAKNSFLCTKNTYNNFILVFEFRFDSLEGNSGCIFRGLYNVEEDYAYGYQCEHDNKERSWTAGIYDEARRGWIFPTKEDKDHGAAFTTQGQRLTKMEDWNTVVIRCDGNRLQTWLNGELRADYTDSDPKNSTTEGFFGLQVHSGAYCKVSWKNLYIKEL